MRVFEEEKDEAREHIIGRSHLRPQRIGQLVGQLDVGNCDSSSAISYDMFKEAKMLLLQSLHVPCSLDVSWLYKMKDVKPEWIHPIREPTDREARCSNAILELAKSVHDLLEQGFAH